MQPETARSKHCLLKLKPGKSATRRIVRMKVTPKVRVLIQITVTNYSLSMMSRRDVMILMQMIAIVRL